MAGVNGPVNHLLIPSCPAPATAPHALNPLSAARQAPSLAHTRVRTFLTLNAPCPSIPPDMDVKRAMMESTRLK